MEEKKKVQKETGGHEARLKKGGLLHKSIDVAMKKNVKEIPLTTTREPLHPEKERGPPPLAKRFFRGIKQAQRMGHSKKVRQMNGITKGDKNKEDNGEKRKNKRHNTSNRS